VGSGVETVGPTLISVVQTTGVPLEVVQTGVATVGSVVEVAGTPQETTTHAVVTSVGLVNRVAGETTTQAVGTTVATVVHAVASVPVAPVESIVSQAQDGSGSLAATTNLAPVTAARTSTVVSPSVQHIRGVPDATTAGNVQTSDASVVVGLTAAPGFSATYTYIATPTAAQAPALFVNAIEARLNTEPALVEHGFIEASPGRDEFGSLLREDSHGNIIFAAAVYDDMPADSLMYRQQPREADLLTSVLPADTPSLDLAIQQFLSQLNDVGRELGRVLSRHGWLPWALGAGLTAVAALELVRRQEQQRRRLGTRGTQSDTLSWVPGLPGSLGL